MASFAPPQNSSQPHRRPFEAGAHGGSAYSPSIAPSNPRCRAPFLMNTPYSAKSQSSSLNQNPYGFIAGSFPPTHMEMSKPASQRNSAFHQGHKAFGTWNRLGG